jgi:cell division protein FtsA
MGGGTTSVGVFSGGHLVHVDAVAVGGHHVTMDIVFSRSAAATRVESPRAMSMVTWWPPTATASTWTT